MTNKTNKTVHIFFNLVLAVLGFCLLFFTSFFSMGSEEQHKELITTVKAEYFFSRFFVNLIAIGIIIGIIAIFNLILRKVTKYKVPLKKILLFDTIAFIIISIIMIYFSMK